MFERVLIGVDGQQGGRDALALANLLRSEGTVLIAFSVYGGGGLLGRGAGMAIAAEREQAEAMLDSELAAAGLRAETILCYGGSPGRALHAAAEEQAADLLIVGACHRGTLGRVLAGDDTLAALQGAPCSVAIAPSGYAREQPRLARIGVGCDGSLESEAALRTARALAEAHHARLRALTVLSAPAVPVEPIPSPDGSDEPSADEPGAAPVASLDGVEGSVAYGDPAHELAAFSGELDLLAVGSRGQGPLGRLVSGSVSRHLARHLACPLLVLARSQRAAEAPAPGGPSRDPHARAGRAS